MSVSQAAHKGRAVMKGMEVTARAERAWGRHAWWIFFILGVLTIIAAPINLAGNPPDPPSPQATTGMSLHEMTGKIPGLDIYVASISRQLGNFMLAMGVLLAAIAAIPYRKGERWAWFALWTVPVLLTIQTINSRGGFGWQADAGFVPLTLAALLLPIRRFFGQHAGVDPA